MAPIVAMTGGGIKGAVAAACCCGDQEIVFLHVNYGQRSANAELNAVQGLCGSLPAARLVGVDMPHVMQLPERLERPGESPASGRKPGAIGPRSLSPVALRGLMPTLMSAAVQCAMQVGASTVVVGLSQRIDAAHLGFPLPEGQTDRRREFLHAFAIMLDTLGPQRLRIGIETPLIDCTYEDVIKLADRFHVPLDKTWTCSHPGPRPCNRCDACMARARAFALARFADPLVKPAVAGSQPVGRA